MPNCREGDLAEFIAGNINAGRRVVVNAALPEPHMYFCKCGKGCVIWLVQLLQPVVCDSGARSTDWHGVSPDCALRPIRPDAEPADTARPVEVEREFAHG